MAIGFSLQDQYSLPMEEVIPLLREAGFSAVSPAYTCAMPLSQMMDITKSLDMKVQSLHGPSRGVTPLWEKDAGGVRDVIVQCIHTCARFQIPTLVLHCWQGFSYTFREELLYFDHFDQIVTLAQESGITLAFENLEGEEFLSALMARYRECSHVGYCYDSGHANCYPHKLDFLTEFGDRLIMTHLNDNLGLRDPQGLPSTRDDLHYLPFDGNIDWAQEVRRLQNARKVEILNFEFKYKSKAPGDHIYEKMPLPQYFAEAGKRAKQIAKSYFEP
jgi:sugar phosphate isomerase/epimerase